MGGGGVGDQHRRLGGAVETQLLHQRPRRDDGQHQGRLRRVAIDRDLDPLAGDPADRRFRGGEAPSRHRRGGDRLVQRHGLGHRPRHQAPEREAEAVGCGDERLRLLVHVDHRGPAIDQHDADAQRIDDRLLHDQAARQPPRGGDMLRQQVERA
jgi:hypothetical protein